MRAPMIRGAKPDIERQRDGRVSRTLLAVTTKRLTVRRGVDILMHALIAGLFRPTGWALNCPCFQLRKSRVSFRFSTPL
jgi:hypothetical protein